MEGLKAIPYIALVLAIAGIIVGASVIVLDKFQDTVVSCYNASYSLNVTSNTCGCYNVTDGGAVSAVGVNGNNMSDAGYAVCLASTSEGDIAEQLPTVAIIGVMVVIISIIAGVFVYMRYFA